MPESIKDQRRHAPATERNREPISSVLATVLPPDGTVLEIASGTGQHAVFLAAHLSPRHWLPSDPNPDARASILSWSQTTPLETLHAPLDLDMTDCDWFQQVREWQAGPGNTAPPITAIVNINMIHISPWAACEGLMSGAEAFLPTGGVLYLYGPFKQNGTHTAPSNEAFDQSLRSQNPAWGVRDLGQVTALASQHQLHLQQITAMPANNLSVVFTRV
ncbi:MAG: DUF938 domain-containing protein [Cyanobacteria bacterium P01_F01_bin.86]